MPDVHRGFIGETCSASWEGVTPPSSLLRAHAPIPVPLSPPSALASFEESLPVATSPGCEGDLPDVISANLSLDARPPTTAGPQSAFACFFLWCHRPSPDTNSVGFPLLSAKTISRRGQFSRLQAFLYVRASKFARPPDRSHRCSISGRAAGAFTSEQNMRRCLRMHRIC